VNVSISVKIAVVWGAMESAGISSQLAGFSELEGLDIRGKVKG
jgi:hypothetical protein